MLLMLFALALTPALCKADVVWQNGRYVYVQPAYQPAYSRDYSQPSNRTDYALGINRYSPYYAGYGYSNYGYINRNSPSYQWGYSLGRRLRGCR
jgi:hypothetical protein